MAIEVKELVVKVNVQEDNSSRKTHSQPAPVITKKLVKECVDQVMQKLELRLER